jgi:uncharacterized protein (DUF488 family)
MATIYTIGHGNRTIEEFVALLKQANIECLVDVRAYPASRRHPHFARAALERSLPASGIRYAWEGQALGGRRRPAADSPHIALKEPGFRAYADHMATEAFREGVTRLIALGRATRAAVMCAEQLPAQCHRSFIADSLVARGEAVTHILSGGGAQPHVLSALARRDGDRLVYDAGQQLGLGL